MRFRLTAIPIILLALSCGAVIYQPRDGDILFQTLNTPRSRSLANVTRSSYNNVGIVYFHKGRPLVLDVGDRVRVTPLEQWITLGMENRFVVRRLRAADQILTAAVIQRIFRRVKKTIGMPADDAFSWDDQAYYASELIWKVISKGAGVELVPLQTLDDFDLAELPNHHPIWQRFETRSPREEPAVSPQAIFESSLLETVYEQ
ncbi:MAG: hypothetical protein JXQ27_17395 [Acidobacteria bacterium]|nr:hypothetical protein [Acidobacteriota bacterium]